MLFFICSGSESSAPALSVGVDESPKCPQVVVIPTDRHGPRLQNYSRDQNILVCFC